MNNQQLALLLTQYHNQLIDIFNRLQSELSDVEGLEYHKKRGEWIGEGDKPSAKNPNLLGELKRAWDDNNWEWVNTNKPFCLDELSSFLDNLSSDIDILQNE